MMPILIVYTDFFFKGGACSQPSSLAGKAMNRCLAQGGLRKKLNKLVLALRGNVEAHHRFMLEMAFVSSR